VLHIRHFGYFTDVTLEQAVSDLAPRLFRYCLARTKDRGMAEEITQDCLVAVIRHWRRKGAPDSPDGFVFAIARRRAYRALLARRVLLPIGLSSTKVDAGTNPEARTVAKSECEHVLNQIRRLPGRDREALLLIAAAGLTTEDAAASLGISATAFRMRLSRARRRLAAELETGENERCTNERWPDAARNEDAEPQ
jgi:RNA polymerase sigma-70 factor, ECF subfamily